MVKRQCIILLSICNFMICLKTNSAAWVNGKGKWSAYYTGEHTVLPTKTLKNNQLQQYKVYDEILLTIKHLQLEKEYYSRSNLTPEAKINRIVIIDQKLKFLYKEKNKYIPYIHKDAKSFIIEYGLSENLDIGTKSLTCNGWSKRSHEYTSEELGGFIKALIWQKARKAIAVQPYISIIKSNDHSKNIISTELKILSSYSNDINSNFFKKYKIEKFNNYDFAIQTFNHKPYTKFSSEISQGLKFSNGYYIIWQNIYNVAKHTSKIYSQTLKEQLSVAKTISTVNSKKSNEANQKIGKFTSQVGFFNEMSLTYRLSLSSGVFLSLWMQT